MLTQADLSAIQAIVQAAMPSPMPSPQPITLPAHLFMPPDGIPFNYHGAIALPAVGVVTDVVSFTVPEGFHGVINRIGNIYIGSGFVDFSGSLIWQIKANKGVIRNYDNITASLGLVNNPSQIDPILIYENQFIELPVNNVSLNVGGASVGGRLGGYFFPKTYAIESIWS